MTGKLALLAIVLGCTGGMLLFVGTYIGQPLNTVHQGTVRDVYFVGVGDTSQWVYDVNGVQVYSYCNYYQVGNVISYSTNLFHTINRIISNVSGCY